MKVAEIETKQLDGGGAGAGIATAEAPSCIAASIRGGARLQAAEIELVRLRDERRQARATLNEAIGAAFHAPDHARRRLEAAIPTLETELRGIELRIRTLRGDIEPMREARAAKVAEALRPRRVEAAARLATALAVAFEMVGTINEIDQLSAPNGTVLAGIGLPATVAVLERQARRWAGLEG